MKRAFLLLGIALLLTSGGRSSAQTPPATQAVSREFTTYNAGQSAPTTQGVSREFTTYNLPAETSTQTISREFTTYNLLAETSTQVVSREFTTYNLLAQTSTQAVSREFTAYNLLKQTSTQAVSREFTTFLGPYAFADAVTALRLAGGLDKATPRDVTRLNVVVAPPSASVVDILDAISIARTVAGH
jgi:hypothetical protein